METYQIVVEDVYQANRNRFYKTDGYESLKKEKPYKLYSDGTCKFDF